MFTLTKKFRFESAHRLAKGYEGKCKNIHGHSWNGTLTLKTEAMDEQSMAIDFSEMGKFVKEIEEFFDHKMIVWEGDKDIIDLCYRNNWAYVKTEENPTCEALSKIIHGLAMVWFTGKKHIKVASVRIEETCTTSCTYEQ